MRFRQSLLFDVCALVAAVFASVAVSAHSASDAYLTLTAEKPAVSGKSPATVAQGEWDIALRDLDFVLGLDANGDGNIVWRELKKRQSDIARYAFSYVHVRGDGKACTIEPTRQMVDYHADGAYAALFFDIVCSAAPKRLSLDYRMFFAIDPSHRAILSMHSGENTATSVLSPDNSRVDLEL